MSETDDETGGLPREKMKELSEQLLGGLKKHNEELQRTLGVSTSFYEKLATLDAAAIAIAASTLVGIYAKFPSVPKRIETLPHWLFWIAALLLVSLICAVIHNCLATVIAQSDAAISETDYVKFIIAKTLDATADNSVIDEPVRAQVLKAGYEPLNRQQMRHVRIRAKSFTTVPFFGFTAMATFLAAFVAVFVYLCIIR